jgi:hypothetical protein
MDLTALSNAALWCRTEGHGFKFLTDEPIADTRGTIVQFVRHEVCDNCSATAERVVNVRTWESTPRKIKQYPVGYLAKGQKGRVTRADVFAEQWARKH